MHTSALLSLMGLALPLVRALPDVTPVQLTGGCAAYPDYKGDGTLQAGPWLVAADSTGTDIDGHSDIYSFSRGASAIRWGTISIAENNQIAKAPLQCQNGTLQGRVPTGVSGVTWEPLVAADIPWNRYLMYGVDGDKIEPYAHYIDGVKQDGVFLGSANITTWAFSYQPSTEFGNSYWFRLLGPGTEDPSTGEPLFDGEFTGFIKVLA